MENKNNKTKWIVGLAVIAVLVITTLAVFSGAIGEQLTGAIYRFRINQPAAIARLPIEPVSSGSAQLATCTKNLSDDNVCFSIIKHLSTDDLTPWMNTNGIQSTEVNKCITKIGASSYVRLSNPL